MPASPVAWRCAQCHPTRMPISKLAWRPWRNSWAASASSTPLVHTRPLAGRGWHALATPTGVAHHTRNNCLETAKCQGLKRDCGLLWSLWSLCPRSKMWWSSRALSPCTSMAPRCLRSSTRCSGNTRSGWCNAWTSADPYQMPYQIHPMMCTCCCHADLLSSLDWIVLPYHTSYFVAFAAVCSSYPVVLRHVWTCSDKVLRRPRAPAPTPSVPLTQFRQGVCIESVQQTLFCIVTLPCLAGHPDGQVPDLCVRQRMAVLLHCINLQRARPRCGRLPLWHCAQQGQCLTVLHSSEKI